MSSQHPYSEVYSAEVVAQATKSLAPRISPWLKEAEAQTGSQVLAICMLRGAIFFYSDLLRSFDQSVEIECLKVSTYDESTNSQLPEEKLEEVILPFSVSGRAVLLVDDICETGRLLKIMTGVVSKAGAIEVKSAVLVYRDTPHSQFTPDYYALKCDTDEWLVGMGLDDKGSWRNLPSVCKIEKPK